QKRAVGDPTVFSMLLGRASLHFFRRYILDMSGHVPDMTKGILETASAVAIELVLHRLSHLRSGHDGALDETVNVFDIERNRDGCAAQRFRTANIHIWKFVGHHNARVADLDFRVT